MAANLGPGPTTHKAARARGEVAHAAAPWRGEGRPAARRAGGGTDETKRPCFHCWPKDVVKLTGAAQAWRVESERWLAEALVTCGLPGLDLQGRCLLVGWETMLW